jgi:hypothetical protein
MLLHLCTWVHRPTPCILVNELDTHEHDDANNLFSGYER